MSKVTPAGSQLTGVFTTREPVKRCAVMAHSKSAALPKKPRPDFPLFVQGDPAQPQRLRWAKKVRGKRHYFGKCAGDPKGQAALIEWLRVKDDLLAGRTPRPKDEQGLTVAELCDRFVVSKDLKLEAGEITQRTRDEAKLTCDRLVKLWGKTRLVSDLRAEDFDGLRQRLAKRLGHTSLGNEIQRVRSVFKYGYDAALCRCRSALARSSNARAKRCCDWPDKPKGRS